MVLQKRLDYGFNGYQVPFTPRAARSARKRCSFGKKDEDQQMCAFDLLASLAGKLLLERVNSPTDNDRVVSVINTVKEECVSESKQFKEDTNDADANGDRSFFVSEILSSTHCHNDLTKNFNMAGDTNLRVASAITSVDCSGAFDVKNSAGSGANKLDAGSDYREPSKCILGSAYEGLVNGKITTNRSFISNRDNIHLVSKDDDEKSSGCTHPSKYKKYFRPTPRMGDRRIRKILASRHWKVASKSKDSDVDAKPFCRYRKEFYNRQRSERIYPFKKRKYFDCSSALSSDGGVSSDFLSKSLKRRKNVGGSGSYINMRGGSGASSAVAVQNASFQSRDSHVKLKIKSFRVPELLIEISETATVGMLKRTVMEAVNVILGGGLRVGVLVQGKKIRDDNKTLLQTGISHDNESDALGFALEPQSSQCTPHLCNGEASSLLTSNTSQSLIRYTPETSVICNRNCGPSTEPQFVNLSNLVESDHDSALSPTDISADKSSMESKALVPAPAMRADALTVVPLHRKPKNCEIVQRRIRRPFSVSEVEALVEAVEKLGTGRWRDVKLRAFDDANHRTYVDLKDKWKTLVHTARISPQQRRGEPVPQELLDRVLAAHAYWSQQQQLKQQQQQPENCFLV